jgi:hypothetical protein
VSEIVAEQEAVWLREAVAEIHRLTRQTAAAVVRIGRILIDVRRRLGHTRFANWIQAEFRWARSTVYRMTSVATAFADVPADSLARFDASALYLLAQTSTPETVRAAALETVAAGGRVGKTDARALIAAARPATKPPAGGEARFARLTAPCRGTRDHLPANEGITRADRPLPEDRTADLMAARALVKLTEEGYTVRLVKWVDPEAPNDPQSTYWTCHLYSERQDGPTIFTAKESVFSAVTLAAGIQPERTCRRCGWTGPVYEGFSRKTGNPLDRSHNCRRCETERVGAEKKRQRGTLGDYRARVAAVRRELLADPNRSNAVLGDLIGCDEDAVMRVRKKLERAGEVPRATERVGRNGVAKNVHPLAEAEVRAVSAGVPAEPETLGASPPACEAAA